MSDEVCFAYLWTDREGRVTQLRLLAHSRQQANAEAEAMGWTPPRWWQWWRWDDYPRDRGQA